MAEVLIKSGVNKLFSVNGPAVNISDAVNHKVSVMTIQLCCFSVKAAIENM